MCELKQDITYYHYIAQGKTTIPGVDDAEELRLTDVCFPQTCCLVLYFYFFIYYKIFCHEHQ